MDFCKRSNSFGRIFCVGYGNKGNFYLLTITRHLYKFSRRPPNLSLKWSKIWFNYSFLANPFNEASRNLWKFDHQSHSKFKNESKTTTKNPNFHRTKYKQFFVALPFYPLKEPRKKNVPHLNEWNGRDKKINEVQKMYPKFQKIFTELDVNYITLHLAWTTRRHAHFQGFLNFQSFSIASQTAQ